MQPLMRERRNEGIGSPVIEKALSVSAKDACFAKPPAFCIGMELRVGRGGPEQVTQPDCELAVAQFSDFSFFFPFC